MSNDVSEKNEKQAEEPEITPSVPVDRHAPIAAPVDTRLPSRKDASLREFLSKMDEYAPTVSFQVAK